MSRPTPPEWKPCVQCKTKTNRADGVCAKCRILGLEAQIKRMRTTGMDDDRGAALLYLAKKCEGFGEVHILAKEVAERLFAIFHGDRSMKAPFHPTGQTTECACCHTYKSANVVCDRCLAMAKAVKEGVEYAKEVSP